MKILLDPPDIILVLASLGQTHGVATSQAGQQSCTLDAAAHLRSSLQGPNQSIGLAWIFSASPAFPHRGDRQAWRGAGNVSSHLNCRRDIGFA
ncbi:hypothetical protein [Pseudoxanthomonas sp.]|uniref:hypothetical protein n=1 Tax=Pseudoxanthomonas sp. TaxID=1871049 RepID=UPI002E0E2E88